MSFFSNTKFLYSENSFRISGCPAYVMLSTPLTCHPISKHALVTCDPINPKQPVTYTTFNPLSP